MPNWIGYKWLAQHYNIEPVQPFRIDSQLAKSRATGRVEGFVHEFYPVYFKPADTLAGHLTFAFKREGVHLEFLARLFSVLSAAELEAWIHTKPTGQYAQRAGFFYEWLTGRQLAFGGVSIDNYIDALDRNLYLTDAYPENNPRWRVRDNLPGTRDYCLIYRTDRVQAAEVYDCGQRLHELKIEYGEDLLLHSTIYG